MVEQGLNWLEISESFQEELSKVKHTNEYVKVKIKYVHVQSTSKLKA